MRTHGEPGLLEQIDPLVRRALIRHREAAMRGGFDRADSALRGEIGQHAGLGNDLEVISLAMLRAELQHLNDRDQEALDQFELLIRPRLDRLDLRTRLAVEQNHIDLGIERLGPEAARAVSDFYHLYDRKQAADVEWADDLNLAIALEAIEDNNHRKALSALWYEAIRTYRLGCWGTHRVAMRRLGRQWLRIGEPGDAAYCAILARDDALAQDVADDLLGRMDPALIGQVVVKSLSIANLRKHFCTACEILARVGDAIPDDRLGIVAGWLLPRCSIQQDARGAGGPLARSWGMLRSIAHRLPADLARRAVMIAVTHPAWSGVGEAGGATWVAREKMVEAVDHLVEAVPTGDLEPLAHQVLPLAHDRKLDTDYGDVVELLCHIAVRGGDKVRGLIGDSLFGPGRPRYHILGQVAHIFGREYLPEDRLNSIASQVARNVRLQVQRKPHGGAFEDVPGTIMKFTRRTESETIETSVVNLQDWHAVARHRGQVNPDSILEMVTAAVESLVDPDNDMGNRISLVRGLMALGDVLDEPTTSRAFDLLERIARGEIEMTPERKSGPLDAIRMKTARGEDLRGGALVGAAQLGRRHADSYRGRVEDLLEESFSAPEVEVRRGAFAAFRDFPVRSEGSILAVLLGTRDPDPGGAVTAFAALAEKRDLALNRNHWKLLLYSARMATRSTSINLRRHAAAALASLIGSAPRGPVRKQADEILDLFRSDICASVREAAGS